MLILLPPSETKAAGGDGAPMSLPALSYPQLLPARQRVLQALTAAARDDAEELRVALGLSPDRAALARANAELTRAPTIPAIERYTGVLYDALDYRSLPAAAAEHAAQTLAICSALFGLLAPTDQIPAYRLSGGTKLPGLGSLPAVWRPLLEPLLGELQEPVVDLRSGAYVALGRAPGAVTVRVLRERDGRRSVVSHDNKSVKGRLARQVCLDGGRSVDDLLSAAGKVADAVETRGPTIDLILYS